MRKNIALTGAAVIMSAMAMAGCNSHGGTTAVRHDLSTAQGKQAQALVLRCLNAGGGHKKIIACIVPSGHSIQFGECALKAFSRDLGNRARLETVDLPTCVLDNR